MRTKPSSASTKKSNIFDKQSNGMQKLTNAKKPTIVKCFICNQMFYSQQTFDCHMDQHQKKVNKNLPDQIQRKTMQSFGMKRRQSANKKNTTLEAISQNQVFDKKILSKTLKTPVVTAQKIQTNNLRQTKPTMLKKQSFQQAQIKSKRQQVGQKREGFFQQQSGKFSKKQSDDKQIQEINEAIRESTMLISQIAFITQRSECEMESVELAVSDQQDEESIQKLMSETQFISLIRDKNFTLNRVQNEVIKVNFVHQKELQNYQIQIQYLRIISKLSKDVKSLQKINKIKSNVLAEVINLIMAKETSKSQGPKPKLQIQQIQILQQQNLSARTCSECLDMIGFGKFCLIQGSQSFHKECFDSKDR